jgi:hypothetical protein
MFEWANMIISQKDYELFLVIVIFSYIYFATRY